MSSRIICAALALVVAAGIGLPKALASTTSYEITNDTYVDSYDATQYGLTKNSDVNYGSSAATKVVTSAGSTMYPLATSDVHTLITLPASFWTAIGTSTNVNASVSFRIRNFNNNPAQPSAFTSTVGLYPLMQSFVAGTGGSPSATQGGTENTPGDPIGADWFTYDGVNDWTTPGGTYDSANGVTVNVGGGTLPTPSNGLADSQSSSDTYITWNISSLINNPTTRAEIQNYGMIAMIVDDTDFPPQNTQLFLSFYSSDGAGSDTASQPIVFLGTPAPEPASLAVLAAGGTLLMARRKRKDA